MSVWRERPSVYREYEWPTRKEFAALYLRNLRVPYDAIGLRLGGVTAFRAQQYVAKAKKKLKRIASEAP